MTTAGIGQHRGLEGHTAEASEPHWRDEGKLLRGGHV